MKGCLFMSQYVNVSNSWRNTKYTYVNVNGSWKSCNNIYVNNNGTWRPLHAYWWNIGGWGGCSASCGGGWQYRTVNCYRSHSSNHGLDQLAMDDSYCTRNVGTKPATQQQCNTHSCITIEYVDNSSNADLNSTFWEVGKNVTIFNGSTNDCADSTTIYYNMPYQGYIGGINLKTWADPNNGCGGDKSGVTNYTYNGYLYIRHDLRRTNNTSCSSIWGQPHACTFYFYAVSRQSI